MYKITYDQSKNRLYGELEGFVKLDEVKNYVADLTKAIANAKPGFTALFDVRQLKPLDQESAEAMQVSKQNAVEKGLRKSALVMESSILKMQFNRNFTKKIGEASTEQYFDNINEAEAFLNE